MKYIGWLDRISKESLKTVHYDNAKGIFVMQKELTKLELN